MLLETGVPGESLQRRLTKLTCGTTRNRTRTADVIGMCANCLQVDKKLDTLSSDDIFKIIRQYW